MLSGQKEHAGKNGYLQKREKGILNNDVISEPPASLEQEGKE